MPRLNVRNVHFPRLHHLSKRDLGLLGRQKTRNLVLADLDSSEIMKHALIRFPRLHKHLAEISVFEKQKQCHWELLVKQEDVFLHSGEDLVDDVLYIDNALVGK